MKFLNSKERKKVVAAIVKAYGRRLKSDYLFVVDKGRLFAVTKDVARVPLAQLNVKRVGLQIGIVEGKSFEFTGAVRVLLK